ncbi:MAG: hypothetical protein AAB467_04120, partial [Patescibacteria group bacterium]
RQGAFYFPTRSRIKLFTATTNQAQFKITINKGLGGKFKDRRESNPLILRFSHGFILEFFINFENYLRNHKLKMNDLRCIYLSYILDICQAAALFDWKRKSEADKIALLCNQI